ncbi:mRNA splicing factor [Pisolithus sp. B1]|nr:mRNA splicing factor [Pisolithus sp. B1]
MSLQEALEARKARLLALRKRKEEGATDDNRAALRKHALNDAITEDTLERDVDGMAEKIIAEDEQQRAEELNVFNIAPKRPNWDLKREMERKLAKLERKTQEAIHTLIRQRLSSQKGQSEDIMGAMNAQERAQEEADDEGDLDEDTR